MFIVLIKIVVSPNVDIPAVIGLFTTCLLYAHKRHVKASTDKGDSDINEKLSSLQQNLEALGADSKRLSELETTLTGVALKVGLK